MIVLLDGEKARRSHGHIFGISVFFVGDREGEY